MSITVSGLAEPWRKVRDNDTHVVYARPSHTLQTASLVTFSQILPTRRGADLGVHKTRVKIARGDVDSNGEPRLRETLATLEFSNPVVNTDTLATDLLAVIEALASHPSLLPDLLSQAILPQFESL